jgi:hypothetical protein
MLIDISSFQNNGIQLGNKNRSEGEIKSFRNGADDRVMIKVLLCSDLICEVEEGEWWEWAEGG